MTKDHLSPEEKLLRLIRKDHRGAVPTPENHIPISQALPPRQNTHSVPFLPLCNAIHSIPLHRILYSACALSTLYLLIVLLSASLPYHPMQAPAIKHTATEYLADPAEKGNSLEHYLSMIRGKTLFASTAFVNSGNRQAASDIPSLKDINLIGIITGDSPQAIIEDKQNQKTYYVNKGGFINDFQIDDIVKGKVILKYKGQKFDLYL
jgi:type II secretory pathway component PulC